MGVANTFAIEMLSGEDLHPQPYPKGAETIPFMRKQGHCQFSDVQMFTKSGRILSCTKSKFHSS